MLMEHLDKMVNGRSNLRIFVPLCGKSWDMKWLADQGHRVIGVEMVQTAIEEFFQEQKMTFTSTPLPAVEGTLFQSKDKRVQIYCCDFFNISPEVVGQVDAIWDQSSMVAITESDRVRYAELLQSLMSPGCRYLLSAIQYDETKFPGPPHHLSDEAIQQLFGARNTVELIGSKDAPEHSQRARWGIDWMTEKAFLITPKRGKPVP